MRCQNRALVAKAGRTKALPYAHYRQQPLYPHTVVANCVRPPPSPCNGTGKGMLPPPTPRPPQDNSPFFFHRRGGYYPPIIRRLINTPTGFCLPLEGKVPSKARRMRCPSALSVSHSLDSSPKGRAKAHTHGTESPSPTPVSINRTVGEALWLRTCLRHVCLTRRAQGEAMLEKNSCRAKRGR